MRPRINQSAVLQRRQAHMRAAAAAAAEDASTPGGCPSALSSPTSPAYLLSQFFLLPCSGLAMAGPDAEFVFEAIVFAYAMVAMMLQHLHLYRTVFWLQHSYNSSAVNWYLMEWNLVGFAALFLGRRILWAVLRTVIVFVVPHNWAQSFVIVARSLATLAVLLGLFSVAYVIVQKHPMVNLLYLAYPISVYFLLFGLAGEPFLELIPHTTQGKMRIYRDSRTGAHRTSYSPPGCTPLPEGVRQEVGLLKADFNMRLKQVAFNSICSAYYTTFVPCTFATSALHYETSWVGRHVLLTWVGCFTIYLVQCFPASYVFMMHKSATYLGQWAKIEGRVSANFYNQWSSSIFWPKGNIVRHGKDLYKAEGVSNAAEPGNSSQTRFYFVFRDVSLFSWLLLVVQSGLVLAQHLSLTWSTQWHMLVSEAILLFANYYVLFKGVRDYFVFSRVSTTEEDLTQEADPM